jgi:hypothetical protein
MADHSSKIRVPEVVVREFESLSRTERDLFLSFVQRLQINPYDPSLIETSSAEGDFFASSLSRNFYVYWSLAGTGQSLNLNGPLTISILGFGRKAARRETAPVG